MSFPNVSDIVSTTLENRSSTIQDNVTNNNAVLKWMSKSGNIKTVDGGSLIYEQLSYAQNANFSWYSGGDTLSVASSDMISASQFAWKQCACPVVITGLEQLQNSGKEKIVDLLDSRVAITESTMANRVAEALYSDGTGYGGKQLTGLALAVSLTPTSGSYGGIDPATWAFWANQIYSPGTLAANTVQPAFNTLYAKLVRGADKPNLIVLDTNLWTTFTNSLQLLQRFTGSGEADLGFPSVKFMGADVVLDGGLGGYAPANTGYFLNTKYLKYRPHKDRNMVSLDPNRRSAVNQDASASILAFAGNMTCSNRSLQGVLKGY